MKQVWKDMATSLIQDSPEYYQKWKTYHFDNEKQKKEVTKLAERVAYNHLKNSNLRVRQWYAQYLQSEPVNPRLILFEAREGNGFVGNPYAFYKAMQKDPRFADYTFCWVYHPNVDVEELKNNIEDFKNTIFVERSTREYAKMLATASCYINNTVPQNMYTKREGQIFISTWHGTPLKSLAYDSPFDMKNPFPIRNGMRNFLMADYLIGPNEHTSNVLLNAYKLNGLFDGKVLQGGYPRIDLTLNTPQDVVLNKLNKAEICLDKEKPTILYTPTWRGRFITDADINFDQMKTEINLLREHVQDRYNLLVKVHPVAYDKIHAEGSLNDILIPNWADANEIMSAVDLLITDYSSIFFDYMVTDKPILFYCWDDDMYSKNRNMYLDLNTLPGPILHTMMEVMQAVDHIDSIHVQYKEKYEKMKEFLLSYDDGHVTERDINAVFFNEEEQENLIIRQGNQHKKRLLFYVGTLKETIFHRLQTILAKIDYDHYDVTLLLSPNNKEETWEKLRHLSTRVRPVFRQGQPLFTVAETLDDLIIRQYGVTPDTMDIYPKEAYQTESNRIFGDCRFDIAVDFVGDTFYWSRYILESNAKEKIIFQQYNMQAMLNKAKKQKRQGRVNSIKALRTIYSRYDKVVSVNQCYEQNKVFSDGYVLPEAHLNMELESFEGKWEWPIYQSDRSSNMTEVSYTVVPYEYGVHHIIPDIQRKDERFELPLHPNDTFEVVMESEEEEGTYIKLIINNVYFGWDKAENYHCGLDKIMMVEDVNETAKIIARKKHLIYDAPYNTTPNVQRIGGVKQLYGIYVNVDQKVTTTRATYCRILLDDEVIGYVDNRALMFITIPKLAMKLNHRHFNDKINGRFLNSQEVPMLEVSLADDNVVFYTHPYGYVLSEESDIQLKHLAPGTLKACWVVETSQGRSYQIIDDYEQKVWVKEEDIHFNDELEY